jgi:hypothetical protein
MNIQKSYYSKSSVLQYFIISNTLQVYVKYVKYVKYFGNLSSPNELVQMHTWATRHPRERCPTTLEDGERLSPQNPTHLSVILVLLALQVPAEIRCISTLVQEGRDFYCQYIYALCRDGLFSVFRCDSGAVLRPFTPDRTCPFGI